MTNLLSTAFNGGALAAVWYGFMLSIPSLAEQLWTGYNIGYNKDSALISYFWGTNLQFMMAYLQYRLGTLPRSREKIHFAKAFTFGWGFTAVNGFMFAPRPLGKFVIPSTIFLLGLTSLFGYAALQDEGEEEKQDNKRD
mmetsp:Transcript_29939/g.32612  ORF Transcript_29939/g.32612 Transcript_29939/m.32612 type:complete len:139 (-) Transcript_29939:135-551(-)